MFLISYDSSYGFKELGIDNEQPGIPFKTSSKSTLSWFSELYELEGRILSEKLLLKKKNIMLLKFKKICIQFNFL